MKLSWLAMFNAEEPKEIARSAIGQERRYVRYLRSL